MKRESIPKEYPLHIIRRGARGLSFTRNKTDKWRNLQGLFFLNDVHSKMNWLREIEEERAVDLGGQQHFFGWPKSWPKRRTLISLWAFAFSGNHDHIIACEKEDGGVSKFMQKWNISTTKHFNEKYKEKGTVFQGPYVLRVIDSDEYLRWVVPYVMVKNTFEMHEKGYDWAVNNFEEAWNWAVKYPFSSLGDYADDRKSPVVETARLTEIVGGPKRFKEMCEDMIVSREAMDEKINYLTYEN